MRTLLYLSGEPGTGKTALMRRLTGGWTRVQIEPGEDGPAREWLFADTWTPRRRVAVELGRTRDAFSGTDALPSTVIAAAEAYLRSGRAAEETSLLLAEGARLANRRFLSAAVESGWRVVLVHLANPAAAADRRRERARALGKPEQNPSWVQGRRTAAYNLARTAPPGVDVLALDAADPLAVQRDLVAGLVPSLT